MKRNLVIVGNGFDLHHNMKTRYTDYRNYLINSGKKDIVDCFELSLEGDYSRKLINHLWSKLEEVIAVLPYEQAYIHLWVHDDKESELYKCGFQNEVENMTSYWPGIKDNLAPWIATVKYTDVCENLKKIINSESNFISFNYTNTLEFLYDISKDDICYIHGDYSNVDELILGHRNNSYYPEWDDNNEEDVRLINAGKYMEQFRKETYKPIETICESHSTFNHFLSEYRYLDIYMMGLSYNDIDKVYIEEIRKAQDAVWHFVCYSEEDFNRVFDYAKDIGVPEYSVITYEDI